MERPSASFFIMDLILLFAVIGFIFVVFDLSGLAFIFELRTMRLSNSIKPYKNWVKMS